MHELKCASSNTTAEAPHTATYPPDTPDPYSDDSAPSVNRNPVNVGHLRAPIETKEAAPVSLCPLEPRVCRAAAHREAGDAIDRDAVSADLDEARDGDVFFTTFQSCS